MVSLRKDAPDPKTLTNPRVMDIRELAETFGISLTTVYELAKRDELPVPVLKFGRQYRFSRDDVARVLSGGGKAAAVTP